MIYSPGSVLIDIGHLFGLSKSLPIRWYGITTGLGFLGAIWLILFNLKGKANTEQKQNLLVCITVSKKFLLFMLLISV